MLNLIRKWIFKNTIFNGACFTTTNVSIQISKQVTLTFNSYRSSHCALCYIFSTEIILDHKIVYTSFFFQSKHYKTYICLSTFQMTSFQLHMDVFYGVSNGIKRKLGGNNSKKIPCANFNLYFFLICWKIKQIGNTEIYPSIHECSRQIYN